MLRHGGKTRFILQYHLPKKKMLFSFIIKKINNGNPVDTSIVVLGRGMA
jgi:hypothetical protein